MTLLLPEDGRTSDAARLRDIKEAKATFDQIFSRCEDKIQLHVSQVLTFKTSAPLDDASLFYLLRNLKQYDQKGNEKLDGTLKNFARMASAFALDSVPIIYLDDLNFGPLVRAEQSRGANPSYPRGFSAPPFDNSVPSWNPSQLQIPSPFFGVATYVQKYSPNIIAHELAHIIVGEKDNDVAGNVLNHVRGMNITSDQCAKANRYLAKRGWAGAR